MAQNNVNIPSGFGGLLRFNEEYDSKFQLKPGHVIGFVVVIVLLVLALKAFFPVA